MNATQLWLLWQGILVPVAVGFTRRGQQRFVEWVTGLALNVEEHTITQSLVGLDRVDDWKALESFAEYGAWDLPFLQWGLARRLDRLPNRTWHGYQVWAGDDTKVHRSSKDVWGTCTFHEYTARCPNRASTVRAHNWVVLGALLPAEGQPAHFLPVAARRYFRQTQLPEPQKGPPIPFRTKCALLVELGRAHAKAGAGKSLGVFDGGFALRSVVRPLVKPDEPGPPRVDFVTRLRHDARLFGLPPKERRPGQRGPTPKWGKRLPPPRRGGRWPGAWHEGQAFVYGRLRRVRYKEGVCLWGVLGPDAPIKAVVAEVEGYRKRFTLVTSATGLSGLQVVELFCARFRQEDAFRDLKQRLGWEECRAWTRNPIERTTQALFVAMTALRLLQLALQQQRGDDWWLHPPWNPHKSRPSVLDVERLLRQHREGIQRCLAGWLDSEGNTGE
ncbi:MAG: transposase [Gemmataceae bacterium]|nr:transposase [Gemmataceae bacterium]